MEEIIHGEKIAEGKTKIIWQVSGTSEVFIESKDDITAGDGVKRDKLENKAIFSTKTTCNCFQLLQRHGIATHFIKQENEKVFRAHLVKMIPVELVARRIATGSYLKRCPEISEGNIFEEIVIEFFLKDDANHDPLMIWNGEENCFKLYDAKRPKSQGYLRDLPPDEFPLIPKKFEEVRQLSNITKDVFLILEKAWAKQNVTLVDFKIECGYDAKGSLLVADVIDNDSWRIWPAGDKNKMKDKQVYRDLKIITLTALNTLKENYAWVAEATAKF